MAQMSEQSPYTTRQDVGGAIPAYVSPIAQSYVAPPLEGGSQGWNRSPIAAWSQSLNEGLVDTPDKMRLQHQVALTPEPPTGEAPAIFYRQRDTDERQRNSVEFVDADGWAVQKGQKHPGPDPRWIPVPENRPTQQMSPTSWIFTRPFDQDIARNLNGFHFSMADHRRSYPIHGMQPFRAGRNTFRMDPVPWDAAQVDMPPNGSTNVPNGQIRDMNVPPHPTAVARTWRL